MSIIYENLSLPHHPKLFEQKYVLKEIPILHEKYNRLPDTRNVEGKDTRKVLEKIFVIHQGHPLCRRISNSLHLSQFENIKLTKNNTTGKQNKEMIYTSETSCKESKIKNSVVTFFSQ